MSFKRMWQLRHPGEGEGKGGAGDQGDKTPEEGNGKGSPAALADLVGEGKKFEDEGALLEFVTNAAGRDEEYQRQLKEGSKKIDQLMETVTSLKTKLEEPPPERVAEDQANANAQLNESMKKDPMGTLAFMINQGVQQALRPFQQQIAQKEISEGMARIKNLPGYAQYESEIAKAIADAPEVTTVEQVEAIAHRIIGSKVPDLEARIREDERKKVLKKLKEEGLALTEDGGSLDRFDRKSDGDKKPEDILVERIQSAGPRDPFAGLT